MKNAVFSTPYWIVGGVSGGDVLVDVVRDLLSTTVNLQWKTGTPRQTIKSNKCVGHGSLLKHMSITI